MHIEDGTDTYGYCATFSLTDQQGNKVTQRLRWMEPGTFLMGSPETEPERYLIEGPQHLVILSDGFWLFDTACTQSLWQAVMDENPSVFKLSDLPVTDVSWNDCQKFIRRLNDLLPGINFALPTEAQWEYACRAGTTTPFSFGSNITPEQVNYDGNYPYGGKKGLYRQQIVPVASLPPNQWGLYEMHGNVWEWCQDGKRDYTADAVTNPVGPLIAGTRRVIRGGSWYYGARFVRAAYRYCFAPDLRHGSLGFRCASSNKEMHENESS